MKKELFSMLCISSLSAFLIGCGGGNGGSSSNSSLQNSKVSSINAKQVELGKNNVAITPSSSDIVSDNYAYTTSNLGLVALVEPSQPVEIKSDELKDEEPENIINSTSPYIVSSKVIPKPITSADGKVSMIIKFDPKLKFDTSVSITNYKSLLALPNNGLDLLKQGLKPISRVSSDIAFYDSLGHRIWNINDKFAKDDTNLSIYLVFDSSNSDLKEGNYTLAYYNEDGKLIEKNVPIKKKSTGTLAVALNGAYPFIIADKNNMTPKQIIVSSSFDKTDFSLPVVAFDANSSVVGIGKTTDALELLNPPTQGDTNTTQKEQNLVYLINKPVKYKVVSYLLKNGFKEFDSNSTEITSDDLDPQYPLVDSMNDDDIEFISKVKYTIESNEYGFNIYSYLFPENNYYISKINDEFHNDFKNTLTSIFENNATNMLKDKYIIENNVSCNVTSNIDTNKSSIAISCEDGRSDSLEITNGLDDFNNTYYSMKFNSKNSYSKESGSYRLYVSDNSRYIDNFSDIYSENYTSKSSEEESSYSENGSVNTYVTYKKGIYYYKQSGSLAESGSYKSYETNETKKYANSYKYELSKKIYNDGTQSGYALKIFDISSSDEITIGGKTLIITKDSDGKWHINNSKEGCGYSYYGNY